MIECALTKKHLLNPIYNSENNRSVTSLSKVYNSSTIVYLNSDIGHLQTKELDNLKEYYDSQYEIFNQSDEDDVLYAVVNGKQVFRQQHQIDTLLSKIKIDDGTKVLDYGCAKGTVMKRLLSRSSTIEPYLFDISQMYVHLWNKFLPPEQYASYQLPDDWQNKFDVVTSFFAFEHAANPVREISNIRNSLKSGGLFYCVVPNIFDNHGDFIVADHVHHYSEISLRYMFAKAGFKTIEVDTESHFAAFIIIGQKTDSESLDYEIPSTHLVNINQQYSDLANFWKDLKLSIQEFERLQDSNLSAIYGAGVYGSFIATCLKDIDSIKYFVDRNPLLIGKEMMGKPIVHPDELSLHIDTIYIGLNPKIARTAIANIDNWKTRNHKYLFI
jgi:cyclopropane fatty-acyl-phospholipid synthase-like methyltransferase